MAPSRRARAAEYRGEPITGIRAGARQRRACNDPLDQARPQRNLGNRAGAADGDVLEGHDSSRSHVSGQLRDNRCRVFEVEEDEAAHERVSGRVQVNVRQGSLLEGPLERPAPATMRSAASSDAAS
jgi:hypothetical protein